MTHASIFLIRIDSELGKLQNHKSESLSLAAGIISDVLVVALSACRHMPAERLGSAGLN